MKPRVVLSGVNFVEAGPLAIFQDALAELARSFADRYEIIALVHRRTLFSVERVTFLEFPAIKRSWLRRLLFEYWDCRALSRELAPYLWLSMHDISPVVAATRRAVYCHNPAPFYKLKPGAAIADLRFSLFVWLYRILYRINIKANDFVVVQQQWMRAEFRRHFPAEKIIVAHPSVERLDIARSSRGSVPAYLRFIYPAFPRSFKNVESILQAARLLEERGFHAFEIWLTIDGKENAYAQRLRSRFADLQSIQWIGRVSRDRVLQLYSEADCLLFPSLLETWGMPLSEFKQTGKPILVADLPYAHETVGTYTPVHFFAPDNPVALAGAMEQACSGTLEWIAASAAPVEQPFAADWHELFALLLNGIANS